MSGSWRTPRLTLIDWLTHRETHKQTHIQTNRQTKTDRQTNTQRDRQINIPTDNLTTNRQINSQTDRLTDEQSDGQRNIILDILQIYSSALHETSIIIRRAIKLYYFDVYQRRVVTNFRTMSRLSLNIFCEYHLAAFAKFCEFRNSRLHVIR